MSIDLSAYDFLVDDIQAWDSNKLAKDVFGLPRRDLAANLVNAMAQPASLVHHIERTDLDEIISAESGTVLHGNGIALIQGDCGATVNNRQARECLATPVPGFQSYEVAGAGHYSHDLQYSYLMHLPDWAIKGKSAGNPAHIRQVNKNSREGLCT